ncbi:MBL fold metallo-hydrolase [Roseomonas sp. NAR14]|uniref:MBL fold metallo-hydrolase n=1 Tax=Roseomonas acroporae TaxID=2937791 RepID=A0A9X1Y7Q6_9PROT|nr:MBL fold metallo-hydrolase [Roseomonas acroporae]MCK8783770.1 MBL fold metallo-hydrolase [Roseomonas acroporae]
MPAPAAPDAPGPATPLLDALAARLGHRPGAQRRDGRFLNPDGTPAGRSLAEVWRLMREGGGTPWPERVEDPPFPPPPATVPPGHAAVTFIGHVTFLIRLPDGFTCLTDPMFSERASPFRRHGPRRHRAPGLALEALPRIDAVLLSHNHYDHMDLPSLRRLHARDRPLLVTGLGNGAYLARKGVPGAVELDWWRSAPLPGGHVATYLPMRHASARGLGDRNRMLWGGFALSTAGGGRLLFTGDTAHGAHLAEIGEALGPFGLALLPIGAYEPRWFMDAVHVDPEESVAAFQAVRARTALAMHFGTFRLTREPIDEPARRLAAARQAAGLPEAAFLVPGVGQTVIRDLAAGEPA